MNYTGYRILYPLAERHLILSLNSIQEYAGRDNE
ncbi:Uncharacterised protein [Lacrimispora sphenoides]|uniref:Uncharacterized protein n=1 Tax=Lacrimispora sphenoides JCM 1415 TaxID=1297793 RepID=A0ABY1C835_9FIRM|nr:hypothetical protein SAMN02745906_1934 [[Clostridium] sphenoides JCM 1415]SUY51285.1 Uncharacterised protein [Lacrimispora sphenoides]